MSMGELTEEQVDHIVNQAEAKATEAEQAAADERRRQRDEERRQKIELESRESEPAAPAETESVESNSPAGDDPADAAHLAEADTMAEPAEGDLPENENAASEAMAEADENTPPAGDRVV